MKRKIGQVYELKDVNRKETQFRLGVTRLVQEFFYGEQYLNKKHCFPRDSLTRKQVLDKANQILQSQITKASVARITFLHGPKSKWDREMNREINRTYVNQTWFTYLPYPYQYENWGEIITTLLPFWDLVDLVDSIFAYLALVADESCDLLTQKKLETASVWEKILAARERFYKTHPKYEDRLQPQNLLARVGKIRTLKKYTPEYLHAPSSWITQKYIQESAPFVM